MGSEDEEAGSPRNRRERSRSPRRSSRRSRSRSRERARGSDGREDRERERPRERKSRFAFSDPATAAEGGATGAVAAQQQQQQALLAQHQQQLIAQQFMAQQRQQQLLMQQAQLANQARMQAQNKKQREIYVGNLTVGLVTAPVLQELFNGALAHMAEGKVPVIGINMDSSMKFAFVEFSTEDLATAALHLDKVELCGRNINVGRPKGYIDPSTPGYVKAPDVEPGPAGLLAAAGAAGGVGLPGLMGAAGVALPGAPMAGVAPAPVAAPVATNGESGDPPPTTCLFLENMVSAAELMDPEERVELEQDVKEECERSGMVLGIHVPQPPSEAVSAGAPGRVYVKFGDTSAAAAAQRSMNGRNFAGNKVKALFVSEDTFTKAGTGVWP